MKYELADVKLAAAGRWRDVLINIGGFQPEKLDGNHHACPMCGGSDRFRYIDDKTGAVLCNQCFNSKNGDGIAAVEWLLGIQWKEAVERIGEFLGVRERKSAGRKKIDPAKDLEFHEWNEKSAGLWCLKKTPIKPEALKKVGARRATYKGIPVIAIPIFGQDGKEVGWNLYHIGGGTLPKKAGEKIDQVKVKLTYGSKPGIIGDIPEDATEVWKTEGPSDLLAFLSLDLPPGVAAFCNANGAKEDPARAFRWLPERLNGKKVYIVHDCDEPGQHGATTVPRSDGSLRPGWAPFLAGCKENCNLAKNIVLPFPIAPTSGKDLRDFISEGGTYEDLKNLAAAAEYVEPIDSEKNLELDEMEDDPNRLARVNLAQYKKKHEGRLIFWRDEWWKYKDGRYRKIDKEELRAKIWKNVREEFERCHQERTANNKGSEKIPPVKKVTNSLVSNVIGATKSMVTQSGSISMPCWLPDRTRRNYLSMRNGMLDLESLFAGKESDEYFMPHSPEWFSPLRLDYDFDESAECPQWESYIKQVTGQDAEKMTLLQEWAGYLLWPSAERQRFLVFEGEGGTGKSTFFAAMTAMVGDDNVSSVSLENFLNRFALASTVGKVANIAGDVGRIDGNEEAILKRYTGGDKMEFDRKNLDSIHLRPTAKIMMAWNERPRFRDKSTGLWRRMILIPLNNQVAKESRVYGMDDWKYWKDEAPGIMLWAIGGLARLLKQGDFSKCTASERALEEYKDEINPVRKFISEFTEPNSEGFLIVADAYLIYRDWCVMEGINPLNRSNFGREIARTSSEIKKTRMTLGGQRQYVYEKISWSEEKISEFKEANQYELIE